MENAAAGRVSQMWRSHEYDVMRQDPSSFPFVSFAASREYLDEEGVWNPRDGEPPLEAALQVRVFGKREHYLRLAEAIRAFADREVPGDHDHFEGLVSLDGNVRVHLILYKGPDVAGSPFRRPSSNRQE